MATADPNTSTIQSLITEENVVYKAVNNMVCERVPVVGRTLAHLQAFEADLTLLTQINL